MAIENHYIAKSDLKEPSKNVFWRMLEDKRAIRECILKGGDLKKLEKERGIKSCFEFLQKVFLGLMYPFSCVLWAIFWSFSLLFFVR